MNVANTHLLDLPDEMLLNILKKLDNADVLYSLFGINDKRLENIIQHESFSNVLNIASMTQDTSIIHPILDRFCDYILPQIFFNIKCLMLEPKYMERLFSATDYPNLTELRILHCQCDQTLSCYIDNSSFRHILQQQITKLDLIYNYETTVIRSSKVVTKTIYAQILADGEKLEHLSLTSSIGLGYSGLSLRYLPSNTFSSSTLTNLRVNVQTFTDLVYLPDGRLKQLRTLIVEIYSMEIDSSVVHNLDDLPNLKCFSLTHYFEIQQYDNNILSHFRRMKNLEKLTLYLLLVFDITFIDPIYLINQFSMHMSQFHSFNFYLGTKNKKTDLVHYLSNNDIKGNYIKNIRYQEISNFVQYVNDTGVNHIFTLPFQFDELTYVGNIFPNILFKNVIHLHIYDEVAFEHEFFQRISKSFPKLRSLNVNNLTPWLYDAEVPSDDIIQLYEIVEYPHLTFLDISRVSRYYVEEFLNESKIRLPCLTGLRLDYEKLRMITKDFTRETTRRNCANVQRLIINRTIVVSKDYYNYFPLL